MKQVAKKRGGGREAGKEGEGKDKEEEWGAKKEIEEAYTTFINASKKEN